MFKTSDIMISTKVTRQTSNARELFQQNLYAIGIVSSFL